MSSDIKPRCPAQTENVVRHGCYRPAGHNGPHRCPCGHSWADPPPADRPGYSTAGPLPRTDRWTVDQGGDR